VVPGACDIPFRAGAYLSFFTPPQSPPVSTTSVGFLARIGKLPNTCTKTCRAGDLWTCVCVCAVLAVLFGGAGAGRRAGTGENNQKEQGA
jgi:hypothetical protein